MMLRRKAVGHIRASNKEIAVEAERASDRRGAGVT